MSEAAAPPEAFPLGEAWGSEPAGDVGARCTTTGLETPDRLGSDPNGTPEFDDPPGWDAAAMSWAAAPPVNFQLLEVWRTEANRRGAPGRTQDAHTPLGLTARSRHAPTECLTTTTTWTTWTTLKLLLRKRTSLWARTRGTASGIDPMRTTARATGRETPARNGTRCYV